MDTVAIPDYPRGVTFEQVWATLQDLAKQQKETDRILKKNAEEAAELRKEAAERQKEAAERQEETDRIMKKNAEEAVERQKETDRIMKKNAEEAAERRKEIDRIMKKNAEEAAERRKEIDRILKENAEQMKETDKRMGYLSNRFGELAEHLVKPGIVKRFNEMGYHFDERCEGNYVIMGEDGKAKAEIDLFMQNDDTIMAVEVKATPDEDDVTDHIHRIEVLRDHRRKKNDQRKVEGAIAGAVFNAALKRSVIKAGLYVIEQSGDTMRINVPEGFVPRRW